MHSAPSTTTIHQQPSERSSLDSRMVRVGSASARNTQWLLSNWPSTFAGAGSTEQAVVALTDCWMTGPFFHLQPTWTRIQTLLDRLMMPLLQRLCWGDDHCTGNFGVGRQVCKEVLEAADF